MEQRAGIPARGAQRTSQSMGIRGQLAAPGRAFGSGGIVGPEARDLLRVSGLYDHYAQAGRRTSHLYDRVPLKRRTPVEGTLDKVSRATAASVTERKAIRDVSARVFVPARRSRARLAGTRGTTPPLPSAAFFARPFAPAPASGTRRYSCASPARSPPAARRRRSRRRRRRLRGRGR
jgi:hypothetical protein